jgi:hypothetical protein
MDELQVIHQPFYRPKQIRAGEYAIGKNIELESVKMASLVSKNVVDAL